MSNPNNVSPDTTPCDWVAERIPDFKDFIGSSTCDDSAIAEKCLRTAARQYERRTNHATQVQQFTQTHNKLDTLCVALEKFPVLVDEDHPLMVQYKNADGDLVALVEGTDYDVDTSGRLAKVHFRRCPPLVCHVVPKLIFTYTAGADEVQPDVEFVTFALAHWLYDHRAAYDSSAFEARKVPGGFEDLLAQLCSGRGLS